MRYHLLFGLSILLGVASAQSVKPAVTPKTEAGRRAVFEGYAKRLARDLGIVEVACAGEDIAHEGEFKFCGVFKGDVFAFMPKWRKHAAKEFKDADRVWIQSQPGWYFGEAYAKANAHWTFFGTFRGQRNNTGFVTFAMYKGLEEH